MLIFKEARLMAMGSDFRSAQPVVTAHACERASGEHLYRGGHVDAGEALVTGASIGAAVAGAAVAGALVTGATPAPAEVPEVASAGYAPAVPPVAPVPTVAAAAEPVAAAPESAASASPPHTRVRENGTTPDGFKAPILQAFERASAWKDSLPSLKFPSSSSQDSLPSLKFP